jgi:hypothetical protein
MLCAEPWHMTCEPNFRRRAEIELMVRDGVRDATPKPERELNTAARRR